MGCNVTDLATDFLENSDKHYITWHEKNGYPGEYRVPRNKVLETQDAIRELTLLTRKYGVEHPGPMFFITRKPYQLVPGRSEREDNMISNGITYYYVLEENLPFTSEFQKKYDSNNYHEGTIDFDTKIKSQINTKFANNPEYFNIGSKEDYLQYLKETGKEELITEDDYEDFYKYMDKKSTDKLFDDIFNHAPKETLNTLSGKKIDKEALKANGVYVASKRMLLEKLKAHLENFYKLNKGKEHTQAYKDKVDTLNKTINEVSNQVSQLLSTNAEVVFADVIEEINTLSDIIDNPDTFSAENLELIDRLNVLANLILGQNIDGSAVDGDRIMFDSSSIENFNSVVTEPMIKLRNKYDDFLYEVAKNAFLNNPIFVENRDKFTDEQIKELILGIKEKGKDINVFQEWFLGANSNGDSILFKTAENLLDINLRKVEASVRGKESKLSELQEKLKKKKFNIDKFYAKDENGIRTGKLISRFTNNWFRAISVLGDLKKDFDSAHSLLRGQKYKTVISWYDNNAKIIDMRKLRAFKEKYSEGYGQHFTFSDEEMDAYEQELRKELGRGYDSIINSQMENMERFINYAFAEASRDTKWTQKNTDASNPFKFLDNYFSKDKKSPIITSVEGKGDTVYNIGRYNTIIPTRTNKDDLGAVKDSGYYDKNFENDIENDEDAYEAQTILQDLLANHINPAYSINGNSVSALEVSMLRRSFSETLLDARGRGITSILKAAISNVINKWKDIWFDQNYSMNKKGIVSNYSNAATREIISYKRALKLKSEASLLEQAKNLGLKFNKGESIDKIIDTIARAEVMPNFSNDIFQNVLSVSSIASLQRARQDTAFIAELLYKVHISGDGAERHRSNKKFKTWMKDAVYGKRNDVIPEDNVVSKSGIKRLSDADKRLKKVLDEIKLSNVSDNVSFFIGDNKYYAKKKENGTIGYFEEKPLSDVSDDMGTQKDKREIDAKEFESFLNKYIGNQANNLGISMTFGSFVSGVLSNLSVSYLGFNPKSGLKNRIEGAMMNSIMDAEGSLWSRGNNRHSTRILGMANIIRLSEGKLDFLAKKKALQLKTIDQLVRKMDVLQDRKDFRDKKNQVSFYDKYKEPFNIYNFAVGMPEYKNQVTVVLNVLQDYTIKNYKGEEKAFVNGTGIVKDENGNVVETEQYMTAYKPGTLELKDEYKYTAEAFNEDGTLKTGIDLNKYINSDNIGFETLQVFDVVEGKSEGSNKVHAMNKKIQDSIKRTQGNFSSMDSVMVMSNNWGRAAMFFKRYLPEMINQRIGTNSNDITQGKFKSQGRYHVLFRNPGALGIFASSVATIGFGPLIGGMALSTAFLPIIMKIISNKWFNNGVTTDVANNGLEMVGMLKEILVRTLDLPLGLLHSKWMISDIKAIGNNQMFDKLEKKGALTKEEINAIAACAQEIAWSIGIITLTILAKSAFGGDDDDEDKKQIRNFIDNYGNSMLQNTTLYNNPVAFLKDNSRLVALNELEKAQTFFKAVVDYTQYSKGSPGDIFNKFLQAQPALAIPTFLYKPVSKGGISSTWKDEKEYNAGQWFDIYSKSKAEIAKKTLSNERAEVKKSFEELLSDRYMEEMGYTKAEADAMAEKTAGKMMYDESVARQYRDEETYEEALDRIDFDTAEDNAEETVSQIDIESTIPEEIQEETSEE